MKEVRTAEDFIKATMEAIVPVASIEVYREDVDPDRQEEYIGDVLRMAPMYCEEIFEHPKGAVETCAAELEDQEVEYDTLVGTGLSGTLIVPMLAVRLNKKFAIVRKPSDTESHSGGRVQGNLGRRWIFVDDLIDTGNTRGRVREAVENICQKVRFKTEYVGTLVYHNGCKFTPADLE